MGQLPPFDIDALIVFAKVVECRSLSRAAALLGMPKSTVSRKINKLESDLGVRLLRRNTRQLSVTELGEQVCSHGQSVLTEAAAVRGLVEGSRQEPQGVLRVALPVFVGIDYAARVGATFLQRYPKARLELRLVDNLVHPVKDGFDIVFGSGPLQDSTLIARKAFTFDCFLCASPAFLAALPEPLTTPTQLNSLPFVDAGFFDGARKLSLSRGRRRCELSPPVRASANNFQVCKQYILQGLGFGAMPDRIICAAELAAGTIVPIFPDWRIDGLDVYMIYPFQRSFSNLIGAFHDIAFEVIMQNSALGRVPCATLKSRRR